MISIRVRFITSGGFVSRSIRWVTNSLWSHVEFGTPAGTWIGAHVGDGVQERQADYCKPAREALYEIACTRTVLDDHLRQLRAKIGTQYNTMDIAGLLMRSRKLTSPHRVICSQFVSDELLRLFGAGLYLNVQAEYTYLVTPEMAHLSPLFAGKRIVRP